LAARGGTWREHYRTAFQEGQRQALLPNELNDLRWAFNFTPQAGGRGTATMQFVEFRASAPGSAQGALIMDGYPPLPYELWSDGKVLDICNFPLHFVKRLSNWEWEVTNANVTFVSCYEDNVEYTDRGFVNVSVEDAVEQAGGLLSQEDAEEYIRHGEPLPEPILIFRLLHHVLRRRSRTGPGEIPSAGTDVDIEETPESAGT
jgi:hypothetical protein